MIPPTRHGERIQAPRVTWTHSCLSLILETIPVDVHRLLDVGCGRGVVGALSRVYRNPVCMVGVDIHMPYLWFCKTRAEYDDLVRLDLAGAALPFRKGTFDVATCIETVEHIPKDRGTLLLLEMERVASRVVVTTPGYFFHQEAFDRDEHQKHVSSWDADDFERLGYKVFGSGNLRFMRNTPSFASLFAGFTYRFPRLSTNLLCVKETRNPRFGSLSTREAWNELRKTRPPASRLRM